MSVDQQSRSSHQKIKENNDGTLWKELKIDFYLEGLKFPDNKIYGIVNIVPESSRKLIDHFLLVINHKSRIEFDPKVKTLAAAGFKTNKKLSSVLIEAIPRDKQWSTEVKSSSVCNFYFTGEVFTLSPTISFEWHGSEADAKPKLVIKWQHIGDKNAHLYILYLDDKEIQYIRQNLIEDTFKVIIDGFESGKKHTFQLAARLISGKRTYLSDLLEFTVPDHPPTDETIDAECVTIFNEPMPTNFPVKMPTIEDLERMKKEIEEENDKKSVQTKTKSVSPEENNEKSDRTKTKSVLPEGNEEKANLTNTQRDLVEKLKKQMTGPSRPVAPCCDHLPHTTFPGIEHYFKNLLEESPRSFENSRVQPREDDVVATATSHEQN